MIPKIHLTGFPSQNSRDLLHQKITALNGVCLDPYHNQFNENCSHVVLYNDEAKPTERILAALAAGK